MDITQDEAELYDRQIRVWGVDAQKSIRGARILLVGMKGLNTEVAKNLVLSGIGEVTLLDDAMLRETDLGCEFHAPASQVGCNRATSSLERIQVLNPNVKIVVDESPLTSKDEAFFANFTLVCVTGVSDLALLTKVNKACRTAGSKFYCGDTFGLSGYFFCDLGATYEYILETKGTGEKEGDTVSTVNTASFIPIDEAFAQTWESVAKTDNADKVFRKMFKRTPQLSLHLRALFAFHREHNRAPQDDNDADSLVRHMKSVCEDSSLPYNYVDEAKLRHLATAACTELMPVCAIVGGSLSQEIIRAVSRKDAPFNNTFYFDGATSAGTVVRHAIAA